MAVDATNYMYTLPNINTFVIVSGDRDFIHVLKALRQKDKTVIGVAPADAASADFAALCDRFIKFESLITTYDAAPDSVSEAAAEPEPYDLDAVRQALRSILATRPDGMKGALVKPMLRRELSVTFDESAFGFTRLSDLLAHLDDTVDVTAPVGGGDVTVTLASSRAASSQASDPTAPADPIAKSANLRFYRFEHNRDRRREILRKLYAAMRQNEPFRWADVQQQMLADPSESDDNLSVTVLTKYKTLIYQGRGFLFEPGQEDSPQRERLMRLSPKIESEDALIRQYEASIAFKILAAAGDAREVSPQEIAGILGLSPERQDDLEYCSDLLSTSAENRR